MEKRKTTNKKHEIPEIIQANRDIYNKNAGDWKGALDPIENKYLKIKVACVVWWDMSSDWFAYAGEIRNLNYIEELKDKWKPVVEKNYKDSELMSELIRLGYPEDLAWSRAYEYITPTGWED